MERKLESEISQDQHSVEPVETATKPSLHRRILEEVEGKILSGEWPPGHKIPFEHELTAQYGCSRMTVNKVMSELVKRGLIERRRKSGSFVTQPKAQSAVLEIHDIKLEVQSLGLPYRYRMVSRHDRQAQAADRKALELKGPGRVTELVALHDAGGKPFCLEERLINLQAVPEAEQEAFTEVAPSAWLISKVPWSAAEHRIEAMNADAHMAEQLGIPLGAACLVIERRTWNQTATITRVRLIYPGHRHTLAARFTPITE